jgi:hypothetical protein
MVLGIRYWYCRTTQPIIQVHWCIFGSSCVCPVYDSSRAIYATRWMMFCYRLYRLIWLSQICAQKLLASDAQTDVPSRLNAAAVERWAWINEQKRISTKLGESCTKFSYHTCWYEIWYLLRSDKKGVTHNNHDIAQPSHESILDSTSFLSLSRRAYLSRPVALVGQ